MRFTNLTRGGGIGANCYRLDLPEGTVLLDCGMHPEHVGKDATPLFEELDETTIRSTILTHARQGPCGMPAVASGPPAWDAGAHDGGNGPDRRHHAP